MNIKKYQLLPLIVVALVGCKDSSGTPQSLATVSPVVKDSVKIKQNLHKGNTFKFGTSGIALYGNGSYAMMNSDTVSEVTSDTEEKFVIKNTTSTSISERNNVVVKEKNPLGEERITISTTDKRGNLLKIEGSPDEMHEFGNIPEGNIRIGDKWQGYTLKDGSKFTDVSELISIGNILIKILQLSERIVVLII